MAVLHARARRFGRQVDEDDLVRVIYNLVRDRLADLYACHRFHGVVQALDVLDVQRCNNVDVRIEDDLHVLVTFFPFGAGRVRVRELVDQTDSRAARKHCFDVKLLYRHASVFHLSPWQHLKAFELRCGRGSSVGFDEANDDAFAVAAAALALVEHRERLTNAGEGTQVDAKAAARRLLALFTVRLEKKGIRVRTVGLFH